MLRKTPSSLRLLVAKFPPGPAPSEMTMPIPKRHRGENEFLPHESASGFPFEVSQKKIEVKEACRHCKRTISRNIYMARDVAYCSPICRAIACRTQDMIKANSYEIKRTTLRV
ncbi:hypothetical protein AAMO2058_001207900 [Amorphochlora amoebiformis]